jgi:Predicted ATP-grasp enzyme
MPKTVLLTNGQQRKTLAAARSLGGRGIRVIVSEDTVLNPSAFSKYCGRFVKSPSAREQPEKYFDWLMETIARFHCDIVFPMDDDTMEVAIRHYAALSERCILPVPPKDSYFTAGDKGLAARLAQACGVPCPQTIFVQSLEQLPEIAKKARFPVVIKPTKSSGSRGIRKICGGGELLAEYARLHADFPFPVIQDYIEQGDRYDVCFLVGKNREILATFVQKELRHFPVEMGPSTVQQSVCHKELVGYSKRMLERLPWYGIIEFEYMVDPRDGTPKFMEVNPRFWSSVFTAIASGVDFPYLLYRLALGEAAEPVDTYKTGVLGRWLLPGDIFHFLTNKDRRAMDPPFFSGRGVRDDTASLSDPLPVLGLFLACVKYAFNFKMWKFIFRR